MGGVSAAVSKTAAAPIERVKLLIQNQVCNISLPICTATMSAAVCTQLGFKHLASATPEYDSRLRASLWSILALRSPAGRILVVTSISGLESLLIAACQ